MESDFERGGSIEQAEETLMWKFIAVHSSILMAGCLGIGYLARRVGSPLLGACGAVAFCLAYERLFMGRRI